MKNKPRDVAKHVTPADMDKVVKFDLDEQTDFYCPECKQITSQTLTLYDPDDAGGLKIWVCTDCGNGVGFE